MEGVSYIHSHETAADNTCVVLRQEGRSAGLKTGVQAPIYRPSVLPTRAGGGGAGAGGTARGGRLAPSAPRQVATALHQLVTDQRTLEVGVLCAAPWLVYHHLIELEFKLKVKTVLCHTISFDSRRMYPILCMILRRFEDPIVVTIQSVKDKKSDPS